MSLILMMGIMWNGARLLVRIGVLIENDNGADKMTHTPCNHDEFSDGFLAQ